MPAGGVKPTRAMVLAAGLGLRLRPVTETLPKPLVSVAGRTMLDRALDHLDAAGVANAVVNCHYLGQQIEAHLAGRRRPRIQISPEQALLDTGGGVAAALPRLGRRPFYAVNADIIWLDGQGSALRRLARAWDGGAMDVLLLVHPTVTAFGYDGAGDFHVDQVGRLHRRAEGEVAPFVFAGVQLLHPRLFRDAPKGPFSMNLLYDRAAAAGRLHGIVHDGEWYHVGTPDALRGVEVELGAQPAADPTGAG